MKTTALLPVQQDPAFVKAQAASSDYTAKASAIRGDFRLTDVSKAEAITSAWDAANTAISGAWVDLTTRRQARLADLETLVPVGPGVPAGASPADAVVLRQAFRAALAEARVAAGDGTSSAGLEALLTDADRFGDDTLRRAALTAAVDAGMLPLVQRWCTQVGLGDELAELVALRATIAGTGDLGERLFQNQAFQPVPKPAEAWQLPDLVAAAAAAKAAAGRTVSRNWA